MKLIALVTLVTADGEIPPGGEVEVKDAESAKGLIERGFAKEAEKAKPGKAKADTEAE